MSTRINDVGEHHTRAAKDPVLQRDGVVYRHVVLHLDALSNHHVISDIHVLTE